MANRKKRRIVADCIYADSDRDANQRYLSGLFVPDPFLTISFGKQSIGLFSDLEISRAKKESRLTESLSLKAVHRAAGNWLGKKNASVADHIAWLADYYAIDAFRLPQNFPAFVLEGMRSHGLEFTVIEGIFHKSRTVKTGLEAEMVREGNRCSTAGFRKVAEILSASEISDGLIYFEDQVLTSELLQQAIEITCLKLGGISQHTIVAGGDQACDPHCEGSGPLPANSLIIVDIFPRMKKHGYHGDMTRTFLKGRASDEQRSLVETVSKAHELGISLVKSGVQGYAVHRAIMKFFKSSGYQTKIIEGVPTGFFHTTGHGLGLEIHEPLRIGNSKARLRPGNVLTVEPGLYYPGLGGCRIEDVVWVTPDGCELLSNAPYDWEIA